MEYVTPARNVFRTQYFVNRWIVNANLLSWYLNLWRWKPQSQCELITESELNWSANKRLFHSVYFYLFLVEAQLLLSFFCLFFRKLIIVIRAIFSTTKKILNVFSSIEYFSWFQYIFFMIFWYYTYFFLFLSTIFHLVSIQFETNLRKFCVKCGCNVRKNVKI